MKSHAQAVVIGGGITGCSILYHLTKLGWRDVVLLERAELTAGSTWHAAAGNHVLHALTNMTKIHLNSSVGIVVSLIFSLCPRGTIAHLG